MVLLMGRRPYPTWRNRDLGRSAAILVVFQGCIELYSIDLKSIAKSDSHIWNTTPETKNRLVFRPLSSEDFHQPRLGFASTFPLLAQEIL